MAAKEPNRVLRPTALAFPIWTASGIMAAVIIVNISPADRLDRGLHRTAG